MKINKNFKLWLAASTDEFREVLQYIYFQDGFAYASNSHILVKIPAIMLFDLEGDASIDIEEETKKLQGFLVHSSVWKLLTTFPEVQIKREGDFEPEVTIEAKKAQHIISVSLVNSSSYKVPNYEEAIVAKEAREPIQRIGVNVDFLADLTAAMGADNIKLGFTTAKSKIFVEPEPNLYGELGMIMPTLLTGTLDGFDK